MKTSSKELTYEALSWIGPNKIKLINKPFSTVCDGELLVKVYAASICGSDLRIYRNGHDRVSSGAIIGHEICGIVEKVGSESSKFKIGDILAIGADVPCESCKYCKKGRPNNCETHIAIGHQVAGGFAEYIHLDAMTVKLGPVVKVSGKKDFALYALAEPLACCINGFYQLGDVSNLTVAIYGAGPIGIMLSCLARSFGANRVVFLDVNERRLRLVKRQGFADETIKFDLTTRNFSEEFDIIFTACSSEAAQMDALHKIAKGGKINFFGGLPDAKKFLNINTNLIHYKEIIVTGSHGSTPKQHQLAVDLIDSGKIDLSPLLTKSFALKDYQNAYELAASGEALKVIFRPDLGGN